MSKKYKEFLVLSCWITYGTKQALSLVEILFNCGPYTAWNLFPELVMESNKKGGM